MMTTRTRFLVAGLVALLAGTAAQAQQPAPKPKPMTAAPVTHDTATHTPAAGTRQHAGSRRHAGKKKRAPAAAPSKP